MFPEGEDELDIPILQISTYAGNDLDAHVRLGEALSSLYVFHSRSLIDNNWKAST